MVTISSHALDSITGHPAQDVRVTCNRNTKNSVPLPIFDVTANDEGRIAVKVDIQSDQPGTLYELIFFSGDYFRKTQPSISGERQIIEEIIVRLALPEANIRYHVPILIAPHSYTVWWSK